MPHTQSMCAEYGTKKEKIERECKSTRDRGKKQSQEERERVGKSIVHLPHWSGQVQLSAFFSHLPSIGCLFTVAANRAGFPCIMWIVAISRTAIGNGTSDGCYHFCCCCLSCSVIRPNSVVAEWIKIGIGFRWIDRLNLCVFGCTRDVWLTQRNFFFVWPFCSPRPLAKLDTTNPANPHIHKKRLFHSESIYWCYVDFYKWIWPLVNGTH